MRAHNKKVMLGLILIAFMIMGFAGSAAFADTGSARIIPSDKVTMYDGKQKIGEYGSEAPLPFNTLLKCKGECGVKFDELYLVAKDSSLFAVNTADSANNLLVKEGQVFFTIAALNKPFSIASTEGFVTVQEILSNAAMGQSPVKGYFMVTEKGPQIGVLEGGAMVLSTASGTKTLLPGEQILLAQAAPAGTAEDGSNTSGEEGETGGDNRGQTAALVIVGAGGAYLLYDALDDDENDPVVQKTGPASPYMP